MKRNYSGLIAVICDLGCMCGLSSCCALMDIYGPPQPRHHHCPPPRHHHHHHYFSNVEPETSDVYDVAAADLSNEQTCSVL